MYSGTALPDSRGRRNDVCGVVVRWPDVGCGGISGRRKMRRHAAPKSHFGAAIPTWRRAVVGVVSDSTTGLESSRKEDHARGTWYPVVGENNMMIAARGRESQVGFGAILQTSPRVLWPRGLWCAVGAVFWGFGQILCCGAVVPGWNSSEYPWNRNNSSHRKSCHGKSLSLQITDLDDLGAERQLGPAWRPRRRTCAHGGEGIPAICRPERSVAKEPRTRRF
jgi:hypothetical protein